MYLYVASINFSKNALCALCNSFIYVIGILEPIILLDLLGLRQCEEKLEISERPWHEPLKEFCLEVGRT